MSVYRDQVNYVCEIINQGFVESSKGTPGFAIMVVPRAEICPNTNQHLDCPQYERQVTMWITDKTAERHASQLRLLGFEGSSFSQLDPARPGHHSLIGQEVVMVCKHEANQNDPTKVYDKFEFPFIGTPMESDSKVATKLDALFGKTLKATAAAPKKEQAPAPVESYSNAEFAQASYGDDDVPF